MVVIYTYQTLVSMVMILIWWYHCVKLLNLKMNIVENSRRYARSSSDSQSTERLYTMTSSQESQYGSLFGLTHERHKKTGKHTEGTKKAQVFATCMFYTGFVCVIVRDICVLSLIRTNQLSSFRNWDMIEGETKIFINRYLSKDDDTPNEDTNRLDIYQAVLAVQNVLILCIVYLSYPFASKKHRDLCCNAHGCATCLFCLFVKNKPKASNIVSEKN
ncbi:hypothetical protein RFI_12723 [Reticulomyxa filosa]|uniref:Uncharacterized protein n=1 Tax=Reticulomyxa filosa TaxID=46433 RepID=X6NFC8_RETFI|nr:hypothetical protein RFI_12723 [Reticulomyxa filosa]|eukprot:ETO24434.1 hypothetical protein RFI_12723 [Reticulomyxa filosa]